MMKLVSVITIGVSLFVLSGCTTLHTAASKGNVKAIDRLAEEGNDLNEIDSEGITPLIHAINMNQKESVIVLLKSGANINTPDSIFLNSPLHHAVIQGNSGLVKLLLEKKADSTARNNEGKSPYDLAYEKGNKDLAELLKVKPDVRVQPANMQNVNINESQIKYLTTIEKDMITTPAKITKEKDLNGNQNGSQALSDSEMTERLNKMIKGRETIGIRNFLNENPHAINLIKDSNQRLRYIGPSNWRVIDIADKIRLKEVSEDEIVNHIEAAKLPYKKFTQEEIALLTRHGLSYKIIDTMISVSE